MWATKTRFELLVGLAWELRTVPVTTALLMPGNGEAVLWVTSAGGRQEAVLAAITPGERWRLMWRGRPLDPEPLTAVARRIAADL
ncbi:hypothetical protein [Actinomadura macrotermitis]|uniref:Uncharacterized protein n=1 Tax=Actinomadura macrotermitis TaxID=2585200 RepID=A0A7K0BX75_9ACTN|nr:hypothetical protein [Actinomadura macrotermitis]MQY05785.1 hypothetical protein [Actinomadura macrotermitis]